MFQFDDNQRQAIAVALALGTDPPLEFLKVLELAIEDSAPAPCAPTRIQMAGMADAFAQFLRVAAEDSDAAIYVASRLGISFSKRPPAGLRALAADLKALEAGARELSVLARDPKLQRPVEDKPHRDPPPSPEQIKIFGVGVRLKKNQKKMKDVEGADLLIALASAFERFGFELKGRGFKSVALICWEASGRLSPSKDSFGKHVNQALRAVGAK